MGKIRESIFNENPQRVTEETERFTDRDTRRPLRLSTYEIIPHEQVDGVRAGINELVKREVE